MTKRTEIFRLSNGMTVIGEPMDSVGSVAFDFFLPAGVSVIPQGLCGVSMVIKDWIFRGAGENSSRKLTDKLDSLGLHRGEKVDSKHIIVGAALEAGNITEALNLYADIILRPRLEADQFDFSKQLALAELEGLNDDPRQKTSLKLREHFYPGPLGRSPLGIKNELESLTAEKTAELIGEYFDISRAIFSIAGKYDFEKICTQIETLFGSEKTKSKSPVFETDYTPGYAYEKYDGAQVHIGLMCPTVGPEHESYYDVRVAVAILSGGMSARLFTEVREKRGLCYAIGAGYKCIKEMAGVSCYAGTTPEKAQETYDVIIAEFGRLVAGISEEELARAKAGLKSALVMQSESSSARSINAGNDYHILGRVRSLDEIKEQIENVTIESVMKFLRENPFEKFTVVTIGSKEIKI
ncbi:MAG: insulinase family protein [Anaerohalosphaeraceae bacterium]|nr:insulinase family protein [Anaerohalosphaeraceae bacterium]